MITAAFAEQLRRHAYDLVRIARGCNPNTAGQLESLAIELLAKVGKEEQDSQVLLGENLPMTPP